MPFGGQAFISEPPKGRDSVAGRGPDKGRTPHDTPGIPQMTAALKLWITP